MYYINMLNTYVENNQTNDNTHSVAKQKYKTNIIIIIRDHKYVCIVILIIFIHKL